MKSFNFFSLSLTILFLFLCLSSCQKDNILLTNTTWKLVNFVNVASGETTEAEPKDDWCYLLTFHKNKKLSGSTSTNEFQGSYKINPSTCYINISMGMSTLVGEFLDGNLYIEAIDNVDFFSVQEDELKLYYNNKQEYLLYKAL
jgi:hypothetical protein